MATTREAFIRFFLNLTGYPPRYVSQRDPIDEKIERLESQLQRMKASHRRSQKRLPKNLQL